MRDLMDIIDQMTAEMPSGEPAIDRLNHLKKSIPYTSPEMMGRDWRNAGEILSQEIGDPGGCDWKEKVRNVFTGKEIAKCQK